MTINISVPRQVEEHEPRISVIGVGGAGGNAVNNMIRSNLEGVEFIVANTDSQALAQSLTDRRVQLGATVTEALGAGARPEVGRAAAEEAMKDLISEFADSNMVFITAGMGGGTGTGAAPVIAQAARERKILTVGVVTKPFQFEGTHRMRLAEQGIEELSNYVDTLIIIPNQNLFRVATEKTTFADAFNMADSVLQQGVRGVTDLMVMPGLINLDFADVRTVMSEMGKAMMGTGEATGENRAQAAAEAAISNPLLDDTSMRGAHGVLINITGGMDMTLYEVDEAANRIREEVETEANIIFGSTFDDRLEGKMRVSVVATGIASSDGVFPRSWPGRLTVVSNRGAEAAKDSGPAASDRGAAAVAVADAPASDGGDDARPDEAVTASDPSLAVVPDGPGPMPAAGPDGSGPPSPPAEPAPAEGDLFVPPEPVETGLDRHGERASEPPADITAVDPPSRPRNRSLLERMTGVGRRGSGGPAAQHEPALSTVATTVAEDTVAPALDVTAKPLTKDDIPSFLRRSAN